MRYIMFITRGTYLYTCEVEKLKARLYQVLNLHSHYSQDVAIAIAIQILI